MSIAPFSTRRRRTLSLPAGARVLFAGLYYGARTTAGTGGKTALTTRARVELST